MAAEISEILQFLQQHEPFSPLPESVLAEVASQVEVSYFRAGTDILRFGEPIAELYLIRSGAVEIFRRNGSLYNRLSSGNLFGQFSLLMQKQVRFPARALEDTLVYRIPDSLFTRLCDEYEHFAYFVETDDHARLHLAVTDQQQSHPLSSAKVKELLSRPPVMIEQQASIQAAAALMSTESVSSLLIRAEANADAPAIGIITDRDLRNRVLAVGLDANQPVSCILKPGLVSLESQAYVFEAMLCMLRHNIHHLVIEERDRPLGVLALSDIVRHESHNALLVARSIFRQPDLAGLQELATEVRAGFIRLVQEDANSHMIGSAMAVIGRSFKQRLLELAEEQLGPAPIPYCLLALGSMARDEQLVVTDQDNALILDNSYDPALHGEYFAQLATWLCDGLHACGYPYCSGKVMANNPQWRLTRQQWSETFQRWIEQPNPQSLLDASIFFDLDGVYGQVEWAEQLRQQVAEQAKQHPRFLAAMARNALNRTPPLGFFKDFVMEQDGEHKNSINLKRRGTAPLADLIRVHALAIGSTALNSFERLAEVMEANILPKGRGPDLRDALEFIAMVRIRHMAADLQNGQEPDNNIEPDSLSDFERRNLKDAFQILSDAQKYLKFRYQPNRA
ncbi:putative nucleotidyltransferase substrate binding domain-containing protein [Balneatrix alpica]|uniref:putative nucleotidyltransferase substrate binding domain-containing protein n=1 Tax=Balneatrix alpica TaxID=75684 RepID=UPI00273843C1|nr:putative nucleotidyltransferase substrate binding domain-containing protein [Balneatrix alpica]